MTGLRWDKHRRRIALGAVLVAGALLTGCGGGGGDTPDGGGAGGDLYAAYERIGPGMSYAQVKDIVGYDHNNGRIELSGLTRYDWIANKNTVNVTIMYVEIRGSAGVTGKVVGGPKGNFAKQY